MVNVQLQNLHTYIQDPVHFSFALFIFVMVSVQSERRGVFTNVVVISKVLVNVLHNHDKVFLHGNISLQKAVKVMAFIGSQVAAYYEGDVA